MVVNGTVLGPGTLYVSPGTDENGSALNAAGGSDNLAKDKFVGWTGLAPITLLLEQIIGITPDVPRATIAWALTRTDRHGVENLDLGALGVLSLVAAPRATADADTEVCVTGSLTRAATVVMDIGTRRSLRLAEGVVTVCVQVQSLPLA